MVYPWQMAQWQYLRRAKEANHLPHALLLEGMAGTGKGAFAFSFARGSLCECASATGMGCGHCHHCLLVQNNVHPNVLSVAPEKEGEDQSITIGQIRHAIEFINQSSLAGDERFLILRPAHTMNKYAANALLKTLEEPMPGATIILISAKRGQLLPTIISRCQRIAFPRPCHAKARQWLGEQMASLGEVADVDLDLLLKLAQGAPLAAFELWREDKLAMRHTLYAALYQLAKGQADPLQAALGLLGADLGAFFDFCLSWAMDLLSLQLGKDVSTLTNKDHSDQLMALSQERPLVHHREWSEHVIQVRRWLSQGANLNKQLVLEDILIKWM